MAVYGVELTSANGGTNVALMLGFGTLQFAIDACTCKFKSIRTREKYHPVNATRTKTERAQSTKTYVDEIQTGSYLRSVCWGQNAEHRSQRHDWVYFR